MEKDRIDRANKWQELRVELYPSISNIPMEIVPEPDLLPNMETCRGSITVAGRITQIMNLGGIMFMFLSRGEKLVQICFSKKDGVFQEAKLFQVGDFISATGAWFKTSQNKTCLYAKVTKLLAKGMRDTGKTLSDNVIKNTEELHRKKYLDMLVNGISSVKARAGITKQIRNFFYGKDFDEVETRSLLPVNSGANAKPFTTKYNSLDAEFYLRVAPELDLKRYLVGGMQRIFEIGKNFRNEGMDKTHNPEFTTLEAYWAYSDMGNMLDLFLSLLKNLGINDVKILSMLEFVGHDVPYERLNEEFEKRSNSIIEPTIIKFHPIYCSPLAKSLDGKYADRFEFFWKGMEIANCFTELNDPVEQRKRFLAEKGEEAMSLDEDFITALEYGMPPSSGIGIGIDRLVMALLHKTDISDVLYPQYKVKD